VSVYLPDTNLLIALAWPSHVHHRDAHAWFARKAEFGWATCPVTEIGFVRVSANPKIIPEAVTPQEALAVLTEMTDHEHHVFWPDAISLGDARRVPSRLLVGDQQVTDAYLIGLARKNGGKLATLDRSVAALLSRKTSQKRFMEIVPVKD
jgi:toxin-antitoxin system PIN domain toxin